MKSLALLLLLLLSGVGSAQGETSRPESVNVALIYPQSPRNAPAEEYDNGLAGDLAYLGATMAAEELGWQAQGEGWDFRVLMAVAPDAASAERAGRRLVHLNDARVLIGGFDGPQADALSAVAAELGVPFINIGSTSRQGLAAGTTLSLMPSAAQFLAAMRESSLMREHDTWLVVTQDTNASQEWLEVAREQFFGDAAPDVTVIEIDSRFPVLNAVTEFVAANEDVGVLGLVDWRLQLEISNQLEAAAARPGSLWLLPDVVSGTREFLGALRRAAPTSAAPVLTHFDPTLDTPEAAELNASFEAHYGVVMDPPAWAAYEAVHLAYRLAQGDTAPVDPPMARPLYVLRLEPPPESGSLLERQRSRARIVEVIEPGVE